MAAIGSTAEAAARGARADEAASVQKRFGSVDPNAFGTPLGDATLQLKNQTALLDTQRDVLGQTTSPIKAASEAQQLWNRYVSEGVAPAGQLSKQTGSLADAVRDYGGKAADLAKRDEDNKRLISTKDSIRSFSSSSMDTLFGGLAQHKSAGSLFRSIGLSLGQSLIHSGAGMLTNDLFGKSGQAGGGFFGNLLDSFIPQHALGTNDAPGGLSLVGERAPSSLTCRRTRR